MRRRGDTSPLTIRAGGVGIDPATREHIRGRLRNRLERFAPRVERTTVYVQGVSGRRGDIDAACHIEVALADVPSVAVEERGPTPRAAFDRAAHAAERAVQRALEGREEPPPTVEEAPELAAPARTPNPPPEDGSYIGRRVGHGTDELERALARPEKVRRDSLVDTARPGVSASERRAGGGSTARRNTKRNLAGLTSALEDSAQDRPSRKSTRRSAGRAKRDSNLELRRLRKLISPEERAQRARARTGKHAP